MNRTTFSIALIGALVAAPVSESTAQSTPIPVTAVYGVVSTDVSYLWIAQEKGIPLPSQAAIQAVLAASANPKAKDARWDQFVEDRFVKELVAAGMMRTP